MKEKKGDMTIGTLIAIILGLVVLVFLIVGFTGGWKNFIGKLNIQGNADSTISDYESYCNTACSLGSESNYCYTALELDWGDGYTNTESTCYEIGENNGKVIATNGEDVVTKIVGIDSCPSITCKTYEGAEGDTCKEDSDCLGYCDTSTKLCANKLVIDGACTRDEECESGNCEVDTCVEAVSA